MRYRTLGATGVEVSEFSLGTMNFGFPGGPTMDDATAIVHRALDAGINLIDTADVYSLGESERMVGRAVRGRRDEVVLATKFGLPMGERRRGASAWWIKRSVEDSLRRMGVEHIDLYQLHRPDPATRLDETLAALGDLITAGKVRMIGASTFPAELIVEAQWAAQRAGLRPLRTEQPRYSIFNRTPEAHVFPTVQRHGMGVLTYGPLASGWLSGRATPTEGTRAGLEARVFDLNSPGNRAKLQALTDLRSLADEIGMPLPHLALAFVRAHPAVSTVLIGPRTLDQLDGLLVGADVRLTDDVLDRIDEIVPAGGELNAADNYAADSPAVTDKRLRRRAQPSAAPA
ncbi:General stress protein 69 [Actinomadura rubteroloni]|uniref:General stress protein 69 n=1 Tax=Actinomadura rubteroloni TaxID=1926885 RepID=A0A2P4UJV2_9ACTN|nr:aldo/keto reductase [Actinomadura rubteroloni]POM25306.1 General stress protein 69 [Actinomadura rubteroloni]